MLKGFILNSDAALNNFEVIGSLEFISGEAFTLVMRTYQPQRTDQLRFVAPNTATLMFHFPKSDTTVYDLAGTAVDALDRSLWKVDVDSEQSGNLMSGNFTFTLDLLGDGTKLVEGYVQNGLSLIITGAC